jgi:hypothetical protein
MATQWTAGLTALTTLPAATLNTIGAAWETYTPTFTTTGTAPALGNGTLTGRYCRINKLVVAQIFFAYGSTTTSGTGSFLFSLPLTNTTTLDAFFPIGYGYMLDNSAATCYIINGDRRNTVNKVGPRSAGGGFGDVTGTQPFTFAVNDNIYLECIYEQS